MAKRKYARFGEQHSLYECANRNCRWQGSQEEKVAIDAGDGWQSLSCPNCGGIDFYGLLDNEKIKSS